MMIKQQLQSVSRRLALGSLAALTLSLALFNPLQANADARFRTANGSFATTISDNYTYLGTNGGDTYYREDLVFQYGGDMVGTATDVNYIVVHADDTFESFATEVCTGCTLGGKTGSFTAVYYIKGTSFSNYDYTGYFAFTGGSGGLSGLNGYGTFTGEPDFSYSYQYRFSH